MKRTIRRFGQTEVLLVAAVLLIAALVRVWGIGFDLPYITHPDEPDIVRMAQQMVKSGDLNPHNFWKPTLLIYLNALLYVPDYVLGKAAGVFSSPQDIPWPAMITGGNGWIPMPSVFLIGRGLTLLAALVCVVFVYLLGRRVFGRWTVGVLAAAILALSPGHIYQSRFITVDVFLTAAVLAVTWFSVLVYQQGRTRDYLFAGLASGVAVSFKYTGGVVASVLIAAHLMRAGRGALRDWRIYAGLAAIGVGFLLGTPFALPDYQTFIQDLLYEFTHYSGGHPGAEGHALRWYVQFAWRSEGIFAVLACAGLVRGFVRRDRLSILLAVFPIVYFVFISSFTVRNERTFLPLVPFIAMFASSIIVALAGGVSRIGNRTMRVAAAAALLLLVIAGLGSSLQKAVSDTLVLITPDGRDSGRIWIENNLPAGSSIAIESYTPFVSPWEYSVLGVRKMIDHAPKWYADEGAEYLVFGEASFGRYYLEPEKYAEEIALYDRFFELTPLVAKFDDGGYEVQVRRVPDVLPEARD